MNLNLASMYGTPGVDAAAAEEQEKVAQTELFCKLAAENGIDLNQYNDEQIQELWNATFSKTAEEEEKKEEKKAPPFAKKDDSDEDEEKKAAAYAEFEATKVAQAKLAEADYLGRVMAHAYVQELGQIGESMEKDAGRASDLALKGAVGVEKLEGAAGRALAKGKAGLEKLKMRAGVTKERAEKAVGSHLERVGKKTLNIAAKGGAGAADPKTLRRVGAGVYGVGTAGTAGAGYAAHKAMDKKGSALDEQAAGLALEKAAEAGWDADEAADRLNALLTLGVGESEKLAAAETFDDALELRSLELLETAGYPINWSE